MLDLFNTPNAFLKGVGPQKAELLEKELGIATIGNLLTHFPFRYVDRTVFHTVKEINADLEQVQLKGVLGPLKTVGEARSRRLTATLKDATGSIELVWFKGARWLQMSLKPGQEYIVFGKPNHFNGRYSIPHPEM